MSDYKRLRKVFKLEVLVLDLNNSRHPFIVGDELPRKIAYNTIMDVQEREVAWEDSNPLNFADTRREAYEELFSTPVRAEMRRLAQDIVDVAMKDGNEYENGAEATQLARLVLQHLERTT